MYPLFSSGSMKAKGALMYPLFSSGSMKAQALQTKVDIMLGQDLFFLQHPFSAGENVW